MVRHIKIVSEQSPGLAVSQVNKLLETGFSIDARLVTSVHCRNSNFNFIRTAEKGELFLVPHYVFILSKNNDSGAADQ